MNMKRMLVTGAGGMVGSYVPGIFSDYELILTDLAEGFKQLDIRDPGATMHTITDTKPSVVLHLAAATDVDRCEQYPGEAYHANTLGTQNVVLACQAVDARLVYVSTAAVFPGDKSDPYIEVDIPKPANVYGYSKLGGEQIVQSLLQQYYIVRAGWMMGGGAKDKKFVGKIAHLFRDGRKQLLAVDDKFGSPTYAPDMLQGIRTLLDTGYYGLYHMVNDGMVSRYEIALQIRETLGASNVEVKPVSSAFFPLPAPRGRSEAMRNMKLDLLGIYKLRFWRDAVAAYVRTLSG
jgi:dTDP-4-dehydrorhamnose reductase